MIAISPRQPRWRSASDSRSRVAFDRFARQEGRGLITQSGRLTTVAPGRTCYWPVCISSGSSAGATGATPPRRLHEAPAIVKQGRIAFEVAPSLHVAVNPSPSMEVASGNADASSLWLTKLSSCAPIPRSRPQRAIAFTSTRGSTGGLAPARTASSGALAPWSISERVPVSGTGTTAHPSPVRHVCRRAIRRAPSADLLR